MAKVAAKKVVKKRRERKNIEKGAAHIRSTFNNTIITITDTQGIVYTQFYLIYYNCAVFTKVPGH